jgi:hypothetical protein
VSEPAKALVAAAATVGSAAVLAKVRDGWLDAGDGLVLVASLATLARGVIRLASDPYDARR